MRLGVVLTAVLFFVSAAANAALLKTIEVDLNGTSEPTPDFLEEFTIDQNAQLVFDSAPGATGGGGSAIRVGLRSGGAAATGPSIPFSVSSGTLSCDRITSIDGSNCFLARIDGPSSYAQPGETLYNFLAPGTYTFGADFDGNPNQGVFIFKVRAVPAPAAAVLFGSALLGVAIVRRRHVRKTLGLPDSLD